MERSFPSAESKFGGATARAAAVPARATLAGFVSTATLTSDNNGLFSAQATEEVKERSEAEERRLAQQARADARPLFEQLQEQREAKDAEWKEKNNPFQPPPGMDEEDVAFEQDREDRARQRKRKAFEQDQNDMADFALARAQQEKGIVVPIGAAATEKSGGGGGGSTDGTTVGGLPPKQQRPTQQSVLATLKVRPVLKKVRKAGGGTVKGAAAPAAAVKAVDSAAAAAAAAAAKPKPAALSGLASLGGYGSSGSSDDE